MEVQTGRLMEEELARQLMEDGEVGVCVQLNEDENQQALKELAGRKEVYLDEQNSLRKKVTKRYNDGMNRKQRRADNRKSKKKHPGNSIASGINGYIEYEK